MGKKKIVIAVFILFVCCLFHTVSAFDIESLRNNNTILNQNNGCFDDTIMIPFSILEPGDIAFKHPEAFRGPVIIDHCLLCVGYDNTTDMYQFIEAHFHHGVQYRYDQRENISHTSWGPFIRVKSASDVQKKNAIDFAKKQIGRGFQKEWINKNFNPIDLENDSLADEWYCSELIWAAYYNCNNEFSSDCNESDCVYGNGIDLDMNGWKKIVNITVVAPREMLYDSDVRRLFLFDSNVFSPYDLNRYYSFSTSYGIEKKDKVIVSTISFLFQDFFKNYF